MKMIICSPPLYLYKGLEIEIPKTGGPEPLKKNGDLYNRWPPRVNQIMNEFMALPDREVYRIGGGCEHVEIP